LKVYDYGNPGLSTIGDKLLYPHLYDCFVEYYFFIKHKIGDNSPLFNFKSQLKKNFFFSGFYRNGDIQGKGTLFSCERKIIYIGNWRSSNRHGKGKCIDNSSKYDGEWYFDEKCGYGTLMDYKCNTLYKGDWKKNKKNGEGILQDYTNSKSYKGSWKDNLKNGSGLLTNTLTNTTYRGKWFNDTLKGIVTITCYNPSFDKKIFSVKAFFFKDKPSVFQDYKCKNGVTTNYIEYNTLLAIDDQCVCNKCIPDNFKERFIRSLCIT